MNNQCIAGSSLNVAVSGKGEEGEVRCGEDKEVFPGEAMISRGNDGEGGTGARIYVATEV